MHNVYWNDPHTYQLGEKFALYIIMFKNNKNIFKNVLICQDIKTEKVHKQDWDGTLATKCRVCCYIEVVILLRYIPSQSCFCTFCALIFLHVSSFKKNCFHYSLFSNDAWRIKGLVSLSDH